MTTRRPARCSRGPLSGPRRAAWLVIALLASSALVPSARAEEAAADPAAPAYKGVIREEDLLLFAVQLDGNTLTDGLAAYGSPDDPLLPLGELARLLDLNLDVSPASRRITGRLGEAQRSVTIDLDSMMARVGAKPVTLAPEDVAVAQQDIYFRASALERILPIRIKVDTEALELVVTALETLPIQARQQRIARDREIQARQAADTDEPVLKIETPYRLFSPPGVDIALQTGVDTTTQNRYARRYDVRLGGDVLYTGFEGYLGSDDSGKLDSVRATFARRQLDGGLLGPINGTSAAAGDTFTPSMAMGARSVSGRGVSFSTAPLEQTSVFDRIDLRGELPIGYDVELYVNDVLRSGQRAPVQGRYEFLSVPLVRGINVIRIVSYGPRGERSEITRVVNVSGGQLKKHQLVLDFGAVQDGTPLIEVAPPDPTLSGAGTGRLRLTANVAYGLSESLTAVAGVASFPVSKDEDRRMLTAGLRGSVFGFAGQLDAAADDHGGMGMALGMAGEIRGLSVVARHAEYRGGFVDEAGGSDVTSPLLRHSEFRIDANVGVGGSVLPVSAQMQRNEFLTGAVNLTGGLRTSATIADLLVSGGFDYQRASSPNGPAIDGLRGNLAASTFAGYQWQLRGTLDYELLPSPRLDALSITADRAISEQLSVRLALGQSLNGDKQTSVSGNATYHSRFGDLSLDGAFTAPAGTWRVGLQLAAGLVFNPALGRYTLTRPGPASGASVAFEAFVDRNGDGVFDEGDEPTPKVSVNGGARRIATGPDGRAFVTGIGASPMTRLQIGMDNVDNPFLQAPPRIVQFSGRAGQLVHVRYPLVATGEVFVTVSLERGGKKVGLSALRVRAVREGASPIEALTEFDGTVIFEHVPPGKYRLEIDPDQAARLHMRFKSPVAFEVRGDGGYVPDIDATVVFDAAQETSAS